MKINWLFVQLWICFWTSQIYVYIFSPVTHWLDSCGFMKSFDGQCKSSHCVLFQSCFSYVRSFAFQHECYKQYKTLICWYFSLGCTESVNQLMKNWLINNINNIESSHPWTESLSYRVGHDWALSTHNCCGVGRAWYPQFSHFNVNWYSEY